MYLQCFFAMSKHVPKKFAMYLLCGFAMFLPCQKNCSVFAMFCLQCLFAISKHVPKKNAMYLLCGFAMFLLCQKKLLYSFAMLKHLLCRLQLALHLGWWTQSLSKINATTAKLRSQASKQLSKYVLKKVGT